MRHITIVFISDNTAGAKQFKIPRFFFKAFSLFLIVLSGIVGYFSYDYYQLRRIRASYNLAALENEGLKGEARLLIDNLEEVRRALQQVQIYSSKLSEITQLRVNTVSQKTGIGPLSVSEYDIALRNNHAPGNTNFIPLGISIDKLVFKPVFQQLDTLGNEANQNALELQKLLSTLSQQKSLLSSIPSIAPVNGWWASGFGLRISPFTAKKTWHMGIDIATSQGTPIYAPADGVIIYCGEKPGFGKFLAIAHGYGVVTRYGHNSQNLVQAGQRVKRGDQIAAVGMTGRTTGPHLHYEVLVNGRNVDPKKFVLDTSE